MSQLIYLLNRTYHREGGIPRILPVVPAQAGTQRLSCSPTALARREG